MNNVDLIYQYLEEYSRESITAYDHFMDRAESEDVFFDKDIVDLCEVLLKIECNLEDESTYNINWSIKDRITESIIALTLKYGVSNHIETIAKAIDKYIAVPRPYLETVVDTFLTVFLLGSPGQDENEIAENRNLVLKAMEKYTCNYKAILKTFCANNLAEIRKAGKNQKVHPQVAKLESSLLEIYNFLRS